MNIKDGDHICEIRSPKNQRNDIALFDRKRHMNWK